MTERTWTTRSLDARDLPALAMLMAEVYGPTHRTADPRFLAWQYLENPLGPVCGAVAVVPAGTNGSPVEEIVGAYTLIPLPLRIAGRVYTGMLSLNTATSPRYQGQGIFTAIARETYRLAEERGAAGVLGFPNENSLPGFVKKLSFDLVGRLECYALPRRIGTLLGARGGRPPHLGHKLLDVANRAMFRLLAGPPASRPGLDGHVAEGMPRSPSLSLAYPSEWVAWRYGACPLWTYDVVASPDGRSRVICRHDEVRGLRTTLLMDFSLPAGTGPAAVRSLAGAVRAACRRAEDEDSAQVMTVVSPGHPAIPALRRAGLQRVPDRFLPHPAHVIYRPLGGHGAPAPIDFPSWALSIGAYDAG